MPLLIHGDAAFAGQGVVAETLNLAGLRGYTTGGTIHVVINNQVGFTTDPSDARSTRYCTDIAQMLDIPDLPRERRRPRGVRARDAAGHRVPAAVQAATSSSTCLLPQLRPQRGRRARVHPAGDVRAHRATQPDGARAVRAKQLARDGPHHRGGGRGASSRRARRSFDEALTRSAKSQSRRASPSACRACGRSTAAAPDKDAPQVDTGVPRRGCTSCSRSSPTMPDGFTPHPNVRSACSRSASSMLQDEEPLDWGTGETLAFATLSPKATRVRLTGQDARARHLQPPPRRAARREDRRDVLAAGHLAPSQAPFEVSTARCPRWACWASSTATASTTRTALVIWEAQFGDFANGAQVIIDQFIAAGEDKWQRLSGLMLLLPHGYEGQGPEHSSARLERFLELCAEDNIQVCNPTTPAQIFHLLRRQVLRPLRKPLVVMTPKSLLRAPRGRRVTLGRARHGTLPATSIARRRRRAEDGDAAAAVQRQGLLRSRRRARTSARTTTSPSSALEQLYPFPEDELTALLAQLPEARRSVLGAGGAAEHGRLALHAPAAA